MFRVHIGDRVSRWRIQKNGLPQGSVLAPTLFNIYINDFPQTTSRKFIYADDICCATQAKTFKELEHILTSDTSVLSDYCAKWRLQPSTLKRLQVVFHLHNASASTELNDLLNGKQIRHEHQPVYLGVTLNRSLTFCTHMVKTAAKVRTRNNLIIKQAGLIMSTPFPWLTVLSNIAPAAIHRMSASVKAMDKIWQYPNLPVFDDVIAHPEVRLPSRSLTWSTVFHTDWSVDKAWKEDWFKKEVSNQFLITDPAICQTSILNIKTGHFSTVFALAMACVLLPFMTGTYATIYSVPVAANKQCYISSTNAC